MVQFTTEQSQCCLYLSFVALSTISLVCSASVYMFTIVFLACMMPDIDSFNKLTERKNYLNMLFVHSWKDFKFSLGIKSDHPKIALEYDILGF